MVPDSVRERYIGQRQKNEKAVVNKAVKKQSCSSASPPRSCKQYLVNWQKALEASLQQPLEEWQNALLAMTERQRERVRESPGTFRFPGKGSVGKPLPFHP